VVVKAPPPPSRRFGVGSQTEAAAVEPVATPFISAVYGTPKPRFSFEDISDDDDDDDDDVLSRKVHRRSEGRMSAP